MNSVKDNKPNHQRNITPNFLRFKSIHIFMQGSQALRIAKEKKKEHRLIIQLKEVDRKPAEAALMYIKNECWI